MRNMRFIANMSKYEVRSNGWGNGGKGGLRAGDWEWSLYLFCKYFLFDTFESTSYF